MFDHFGFRVKDLDASRRFYDAVAQALGFAAVGNTGESFVLVRSEKDPVPFLWIGTTRPSFWQSEHQTSAAPIHLAFQASGEAQVDAFHAAALKTGGTDNGAPGPRQSGGSASYYAAFVIDPDGNNIEAGFRS